MPQVTSEILAGTPWTFWAARLTDKGNVQISETGKATSATKTYTVVIPQSSDLVLSSVSGLPARGAAYPGYSALVVSDYRATCANATAGIWEIEVQYRNATTTTVPPEEPGGQPTTYIYRNVAFGTNGTTRDVLYDAGTGKPLRNMNYDPYADVPQTTVYAPTVTFTRLQTDLPSAATYAGTINGDAVTVMGVTFPKHTAMIQFSARVVNETVGQTVYPYEVTFSVIGRRNEYGRGASVTVTVNGQTVSGNFYRQGATLVDIGYDEAILETGYNVAVYAQGGTAEKKRAQVETTGGVWTDTTEPVPLNNNGAAAKSSEQYVIREWQTVKATNWGALKLPAAIPDNVQG